MGLVLVKELALIDLEAHVRIADVRMRALPMLRADTAMCANLLVLALLLCLHASTSIMQCAWTLTHALTCVL